MQLVSTGRTEAEASQHVQSEVRLQQLLNTNMQRVEAMEVLFEELSEEHKEAEVKALQRPPQDKEERRGGISRTRRADEESTNKHTTELCMVPTAPTGNSRPNEASDPALQQLCEDIDTTHSNTSSNPLNFNRENEINDDDCNDDDDDNNDEDDNDDDDDGEFASASKRRRLTDVHSASDADSELDE